MLRLRAMFPSCVIILWNSFDVGFNTKIDVGSGLSSLTTHTVLRYSSIYVVEFLRKIIVSDRALLDLPKHSTVIVQIPKNTAYF